MTDGSGEEDVVGLLHRQHAEITSLFDEVAAASADDRGWALRNLVRMLAVHETAEEELVHPVARQVPGGQSVVDARLGEEHRAKDLLSTLDGMGPDADGFDTLLGQLRDDVLAHARHEEREEFPLLPVARDAEELRAMAATVRAAESFAPTRPHPGVESTAANLVLGPPAAIMDRVRDTIRSALGR